MVIIKYRRSERNNMKNYKLSRALAWQKVEKYDLVYFLELKSGNFFYFTETGAFIIEMILNEEDYISYKLLLSQF